RQRPRGAVTDQGRKGVNGCVERARPDADEQFLMNPCPAREQVMLSAVLLATVVEHKQHGHARDGANDQPEIRSAEVPPKARGEILNHVLNGSTIGSRTEDGRSHHRDMRYPSILDPQSSILDHSGALWYIPTYQIHKTFKAKRRRVHVKACFEG